jgi:predicted AlkP superfamily pyrophosphatase or phosphodiesterase
MILIDAFSKAYCSPKYTPFLHELGKDGTLTNLKPIFAFRGIEATMFTGLSPDVHNVWTEFCFKRKRVIDKKDLLLQQIVRPMDLLPDDWLRSRAKYLLEKYVFKKSYRLPNLIPAAALPYIEASQKKDITEVEALGKVQTVFDIFRKFGIPFVFIEPSSATGDLGVLKKARNLIKKDMNCRFWYLELNHLDFLGHRFGPVPSRFSDYLIALDSHIEQIITLLKEKHKNLNILVLADHGMSKVNRTINIIKGLDQLRSKRYEDYIFFADSTMARFWFFSKKARIEIMNYLRSVAFAHILTKTERSLLKVPFDLKYGETICALDEGVVIYPDFFHAGFLVKGMHGYAYPHSKEALPVLIVSNEITGDLVLSDGLCVSDVFLLILQSCGIIND